MARYRVQGPDGQIHVFEGPDGASPSDIEAFAAKTFTPGAPKDKTEATPMAKADVPGFGETMLIGAGRTFDRVGKGMQQLYYGATSNKEKQDELKAAADEETRLYKPLKDARPWATGIGESLPSMVIPAGGSASLLGNAMRMGVAGAAPGVLEYGTAGERGQRGLIGAAAGAAAPVAGALLKSGASLLEPLYKGGREAIAGRTLNRVAGDSASAIKARLGAATELVPGSAPTAAEVAESGGIAALQRSASAANPEAYTRRAMEQGTARMNALRGIAGDDAAIAAQTALRKSTTEPMYQQAKGAVYMVDDKLKNLLDRPVVRKAAERAKTIAENDGRKFDFVTKTNAPFAGVGGVQSETSRQVTGQGLQDLKMAMDALLKDPASGIAGKEIEQAKNLRGSIVKWMEDANPEFKTARTTFADLSKPINQMQVGQALTERLQPALGDYGALGQETAARFAGQLRNSDILIKSATGFPGAGSLEQVMGPQNMSVLNAIGSDLARKTNAQNLGRGVGSDTFQKLALQNIAQQSGMPKLVGGMLELPGVSRATNWMYRDTDQQMQSLLAEALLNPKAAAELMTKADKRILEHSPMLRRLIEQSAVRGGGLAGLAGVSSQSQP